MAPSPPAFLWANFIARDSVILCWFSYLTAVFFYLLKGYARLAILIFCRGIIINNKTWLAVRGPMLLAANHPNSFLDGIILTILFQQNIYTLARGDAFENNRYNRILRWLHLLPVYRTSEGLHNLEHNYTTFETCREIFQNGGIVLIFSEGACVNEWHLRPLKKGTARLAISAWQQGVDLIVLPVGINYNAFRNFGKNVFINFGIALQKTPVLNQVSEGKILSVFNEQLEAGLQDLVLEINAADTETLNATVSLPISPVKRFLLTAPAALGWLLHAPFYYGIKGMVTFYFDNDHFDSALVGLLVLLYPLYLILIVGFSIYFFGWMALIMVPLLPFVAWCVVQVKAQIS